mgnify:CR=1 FL=1
MATLLAERDAARGENASLTAQVDDLRRFYQRFNPAPGDRNVWSPLSRLRLDMPVLGDAARDALGQRPSDEARVQQRGAAADDDIGSGQRHFSPGFPPARPRRGPAC